MATQKRSVPDAREGLCAYDKLAKLWADEKFADATVHCKGTVWRVHKGVLCLNSEYFGNAFEGHFKEAEEAKIDFPEDEPTTIGQILEWIYLSEYTVVEDSSAAYQHAKLYAAADQYFLPKLQASALSRFVKALATSGVSNELIQAVYGDLGDFGQLREPLILHLRRRMADILEDTDFVALLTTIESLAYDLLKASIEPVEPSEDEKELYCNGRNCKRSTEKEAVRQIICKSCGSGNNLRQPVLDIYYD